MLSELLSEAFLIFPKIVLFLIGEHPRELRDLFWVALNSSNNDVIFESLYFGDELKHVLKALPPLSDTTRTELQKAIESAATKLNPKEDEQQKLLWKQKRYKALSEDPHFLAKYNELKQLTNEDWDLQPAVGPVKVRWGPGPSGTSVEKLLSFDTQRIVEHLTNFKPSQSWDGPTRGGLADTLENAVAQAPQHFTRDLSPFLTTAYLWIGRVLRGFHSAKKREKDIDWNSIVAFLESLTATEIFWSEQLPILSEGNLYSPTFKWVLDESARLLEVMIENDNLSVQLETVGKFKDIIRNSLSRVAPPETPSYDEPVMQAINSTIGKLLEAFLRTVLYQARNQPMVVEDEVRWEDGDRLVINDLLQRGVCEAWTIAGMFFPNITYLDKKWAEDLARNRVTNLKDPVWLHFFTGYLHQSRFHDATYSWMRESYCRALREEKFDDASRSRLSQHIVIAYLRKHEALGVDSLIERFLAEAGLDQIREALSFLKFLSVDMSRDGKISNHYFSPRVLAFWKTLDEKFSNYGEDESEELRQTIAALAGLARFLPEIDQSSYRLLSHAVSNFSGEHEHPFFLEHLIYLKAQNSSDQMRKWIGLLILDLLKVCTPTFRNEHVSELVKWVYENEECKKIANDICNTYARRGSDILVELYRKNNSPP